MQWSARTTLTRRFVSRLLMVVAAVVLVGGLPAASAVAQTHHKHAVKHRARHHRRAHAPAKVAQPASNRAAASASVPTPAAAVPATCAGADLVPTDANLIEVRAATLCLINNQRAAAAAGLAALRESSALDAAAASHSADMVAGNYFDHVAPTGLGLVDQILAVGYATVGTLRDLGENLATGVDSLATPASTVATWMASPGHRENILDPGFTDTGIGVVASAPAMLGTGGAGATYTQWLGSTA
jgi:uncharacterized protein YkwD